MISPSWYAAHLASSGCIYTESQEASAHTLPHAGGLLQLEAHMSQGSSTLPQHVLQTNTGTASCIEPCTL